jgi:6-phosphogluconolactonase
VSDPSGGHVFGVDLGADKIHVLYLDLASGALARSRVPFAPIDSGSGPRHLVFHPRAPRAYVLNELGSSVGVFAYDAARGALRWLQTISTLPERFTRDNIGGEIRIHPDGRYLYATNRGHDSLACFAIDPETGRLQSLGWQTTSGDWPRGMNIDPAGDFLYVANQNSGTIVTFRIDRASGALHETATVATPTPADIAFL